MKRLLIVIVFFIDGVFADKLDIEQVSDAVVNVAAKVKPPLSDILNAEKKPDFIANGSGVIIDAKEGYIVTNAHVIQDPELIIVTLNNGKRLKAKEIGKDTMTDLALIQVDDKHLTSMPLAKSRPQVGQSVVAVGNPFGLDHTITSGIISGLNRQLGQLYNLIQTDAPINPGNSGGALVNRHGELLGICTAITTVTGGSIGLGFVIPIDTVQPIIEQLKKHGDVKRGTFGVVVQEISPALHNILKLDKNQKGVLIAEVLPGSAAMKHGLLVEDVITNINGYDTCNPNELKAAVSGIRVEDDIKLSILRKNKPLEITAKLVNMTETDDTSTPFSGADLIEFNELNANGKIQSGLLITDVKEGSNAFLIGLQKGDLVKAINRDPISTLKSLKAKLEKDASNILITVERNEQNLYLGSF